MRTKDILIRGFNDIQILMQYLYMNENHSVTVNNGLADLTIKMNDSLNFTCTNGNFPDLPPMSYNDEMTLQCMLNIISHLKAQPPQEFKDEGDKVFGFPNRWEEIKTITQANIGLNVKR